MDKKYYYLIAQLPSLQYGEKAPYTPDEFREQCKAVLSKHDYAVLHYCTMDMSILEDAPKTNSVFINAWVARECTLGYTLSHLRAAKLKRGDDENPEELPHDVPRAEAAAHAAFAMGNPLEAELFLDEGRWEAIEAMQGYKPFSADVIFAHALKLLLMQRRFSFNPEEGLEAYTALYTSILQRAETI
ncbi:MAG: hypothetical protein LBN21_07735 [Treponema sp.]|nr:hypothetical protein [Treponema sp.]